MTNDSHTTHTPTRPRGAGGFYLVSAAATAVSVNTSWRFFGEVLHITNKYERAGMFAILEIALVSCGYAMRANVRRGDGPGPSRIVAWALCALSGYMAVMLSGPAVGLVRVVAGPVMAVVFLHLALGIEVRARKGQRSGTWARIGREIRERALSRMGLGDDTRDALSRTRDRAADRAARLATTDHVLFRSRRLARAVRASGAALDPGQRARLVAGVAAFRNLSDLMTMDTPSPWSTPVPPSPRHAADDQADRDQATPDPEPQAVIEPHTFDGDYTDSVLDGAVLAADTPPPWAGMPHRTAVARADQLLPGRTAKALSAALTAVGVVMSENAIRAARSAIRKQAASEAKGQS